MKKSKEDQLIELEEEMLSNKIRGSVFLERLSEMNPPKSYRTKEWQKARKLSIGNVCEVCNTTTGPFVIQHRWHPRTQKQIRLEETNLLLDNKMLEKWKCMSKKPSKKISACPHCKSEKIKLYSKLSSEKGLSKKRNSYSDKRWFCKNCRSNFDIALDHERELPFSWWSSKNRHKFSLSEEEEEVVLDKVAKIVVQESRSYRRMTNPNFITSCRKCAFLEDRGQGLISSSIMTSEERQRKEKETKRHKEIALKKKEHLGHLREIFSSKCVLKASEIRFNFEDIMCPTCKGKTGMKIKNRDNKNGFNISKDREFTCKECKTKIAFLVVRSNDEDTMFEYWKSKFGKGYKQENK